MCAFYRGFSLFAGSLDLNMNVEFVGVFFLQFDVDVVFGDVALGGGKVRVGAVAQHLQAETRLAADGAQGDGDGQSYHSACAWDAYAHGILQDISAQAQLNSLWQTAQ